MLRGDFEPAWQETDRIEIPRRHGHPSAHQLVWDGSDFRDKTVLLRCEHGIGDTVQFIRYAPLLKESCRRLIVKTQPNVMSLVSLAPGVDQVSNAYTADPDPAHDVAIECMELPYAFRTTLGTIPACPALPIAGNAASRDRRFKVGLVWAANSWNPSRSIPLAHFAAVSAIHNLAIHCLQHGPARSELHEAHLPIVNPDPPATGEVLETAALIMNLDLVITVDTLVAHLAGTLGKPVWVLLLHAADWRWMIERDDSPWYPAMRLFRQAVPGDWTIPIHRVIEELARLA
jgi:ADP-heptose:LPS heptosyltransferase